MNTWILPAVFAATLGALTVFTGASAQARTATAVPYPPSEVWSSAVRFLRIDAECPVHEKDEEAGYVLFDFVDGKKKYKASLELVSFLDEEGRDATQVVVSIPALPAHYELTFGEKLARKVSAERGMPAPGRQRKPVVSTKPTEDETGSSKNVAPSASSTKASRPASGTKEKAATTKPEDLPRIPHFGDVPQSDTP